MKRIIVTPIKEVFKSKDLQDFLIDATNVVNSEHSLYTFVWRQKITEFVKFFRQFDYDVLYSSHFTGRVIYHIESEDCLVQCDRRKCKLIKYFDKEELNKQIERVKREKEL